ncbi:MULTISPECIES: GntR family transcriptional regulator [Streptosporangium]|uniref:DNA-binding GntR family transcriptional regulator n=1 Tax=Streptosporangium brasiliense TaxID=47480 RepID=A0ABT9R8M8_9ACTN|nr:GntR family transcriptional regulator [Streptosporangium brasiliense]MDP9865591.1 DNA-binding GntR family transcriptional regulator [Streptosporangium brasiliense]
MGNTDRRRPYLRIADDIRREMAAGRYAVGEQLPVARELADKYGVAMMTIGNALAVLRDEGLIETRQGSGSFVTRMPEGGDDRQAVTEEPSEEFLLLSQQLREIREHVQKLSFRLDELDARTRPDQPER